MTNSAIGVTLIMAILIIAINGLAIVISLCAIAKEIRDLKK
jgi:hypothetical protein